MIKRALFLALLVASSTAVLADREGKWWTKLTLDQKLFYVAGLRDGLSTAAPMTGLSGDELRAFGDNIAKFNKTADTATVCTGVTAFYHDFKNTNIPVRQAILVVVMQVGGAEDREIQGTLTSLRRTAAE